MFKELKCPETNKIVNRILKINGNVVIPFDEANTDYQEYLAWLAEGNTPEPADDIEE